MSFQSHRSDDGYLAAAKSKIHGRKEYGSDGIAMDMNTEGPMIFVKGLISARLNAEVESFNLGGRPGGWIVEHRPEARHSIT